MSDKLMEDKLKEVFDRVKGDSQFAKELLFDGVVPTCKKTEISLNSGQVKILEDAIRNIRRYYLEKMYIVAQEPDVLGNIGCGICFSWEF